MAERVEMSPARYPLSGRLPADVVDRSHNWFMSYRNYPVFSSPWFWRRTALFAPCASCIALVQSMLFWRLVDRETAVILTSGFIAVWVTLVTAGAALATIVRHREMSRSRERVAVVIAVLAGIAICFYAQHLANRLQLELLIPRAVKAGTIQPPTAQQRQLDVLVLLSVYASQGVMFFFFSGGAGLRTYFKEPEGWRFIQREREIAALRQQKSEVDLKLAVLQAQVEPHFLFNTLASVHSLIRSDPTRAEATIEALVDHLRATLPKLRAGVGTPHATLATQLEVCRSYLEVMRVRMGDRLQYQIEVPDALLEHPFPPFTLISLVENAVKHGIEPSAVGGSIAIRAAVMNGNELHVTVQDDGVGLKPGLSDGVGLVNLRAQLAAQFGSQGRFAINGRADRVGVDATIAVPYIEATT